MTDLADPLTPAALERHLRTALFAHRVHYYATIGSTNDRALELATAGEAEGSLVLAEEQTGGRGRRDRTWCSQAGAGIYASIILRPGVPAGRAPLFTFMAALAVAEGLREAAAIAARIKWPNDVVVGSRKIAGILGEVRGSDPVLRDMVVGFGVNVRQSEDDLPVDLRGRATSVRIAAGAPVERAPLLALVLQAFERRYRAFLSEGPRDLIEDWQSLSAVPPGGRVVIEGPGGRCEGAVAGVDDEGALILEVAGSGRRRMPFGEIVRCEWR